MPPRSQPILCLCEAHQISTVPLPHIAYQSLCVPSIARPSLCFATQLQVMPSLHAAVEAFAVRRNTTPLLRFATPRRCRSMPVFAARSHASPSRYYAVHRPSVAFRYLCVTAPCLASPLHLLEHFVGEPSLSGVPPLADASEPSVIQPFHDDILVRLFV